MTIQTLKEALTGNDHTVRLAYARLAFWKGNVAATGNENWDRVVVQALKAGPYVISVEFKVTNKDQKRTIYLLDDVLRVMECAYELGKRDKLQELRDFLEIPR